MFASELKGLLESAAVRRDLNYTALHQYFLHLTLPEPDSVFTDVRKLPAAHVLVWQDGHSHERAYWDLTQTESDGAALTQEAIDRLEASLAESVTMSLRSDVPVGVFLSGGLDSSLLTWMASRATGTTLQTFSVALKEPQFDEREYSRAVANACGTEHHELEITVQQAADTLLHLACSMDEPFADSSAILVYLLARHARTAVKAVLTGEGADELFGGYPWHEEEDVGNARLERLLHPTSKIIFAPQQLDAIYSNDLRRQIHCHEYEMPAGMRAKLSRCKGPLEQRLCVDLHSYLPSDLLMKNDRMTMLASLEARVPYLNHPFPELAWQLPAGFKLKDGVRKYILKKLGEGKLPPEILSRPKKGFSIPMDLWLWMKGDFRDTVLETLLDARTRGRGQFNTSIVQSMVNEHDRIQRFHGYRLWTLFVFEMWQRSYVDAPSAVPS